jgi:hypothetical protein
METFLSSNHQQPQLSILHSPSHQHNVLSIVLPRTELISRINLAERKGNGRRGRRWLGMLDPGRVLGQARAELI